MTVRGRLGAAVAVATLLSTVAIAPVGAAGPTIDTIASGLGNPRGIAVAPSGHVFVADAGQGAVGGGFATNGALLELTDRPGKDAIIHTIAANLPSASSPEGEVTGPTNVDVRGDGTIALVIGGGPQDVSPLFDTLLRGAQGRGGVVADIQAFRNANPQPICDAAPPEELEIWCDHDPTPNPTDSNAYGVAVLNKHRTLVTDAAGNDLLLVDHSGNVTEIARFPNEAVSGAHIGIPALLVAEPVPTSVDVGPDGYWYVGELKGFPFTPGASRIWRIAPWARGVDCDPDATSGDCTLFADGFTSITGLDFGPDGALYVVEIVKSSVINLFGGTDFQGGLFRLWNGTKTEIAAGALTVPGDVAVARDGTIYVTNKSVFIGGGEVLAIRP